MTPAKKALMGIGGFLPIVGGIILMVCYFSFVMHVMQSSMALQPQQQPDPNVFLPQFLGFFKMMFGVGIPLAIISLTLMVLYIVHAVNNSALSDVERIVWIIMFVLVGVVAFPVYFFMRIAGKSNEGRVVNFNDPVPGTF